MREEKLLLKALEIAGKAKGKVFPNPYVGCLIEKKGRIIAFGYHNAFGEKHAEIMALEKAKRKARNSKMIVSLEPCCHYGKTKPCTKEIIKAGIKEVVIGLKDFNPKVKNKGIKELKKAGIKVKVIESKKIKEKFIELNEPYIKFISTKKPFVLTKIALSIDGIISFGNRKRKKISGRQTNKIVQELRKKANAIIVGINTVLKDNPRLTVHKKPELNPIRTILDPKMEIPLKARLLKEKGKTIIFVKKNASKKKELKIKKRYKEKVEIIRIKSKNNYLNLNEVLKELSKRNVAFVIVEGGQKVFSSFIKEKKTDKTMLIIACKSLANKKNALFFVDKRIKKIKLKNVRIKKKRKDIIVEGYNV